MKKTMIPTADWFRRSAIYQINPRTFSEEGTLAAVTKELPCLQELGFRVIYLCAINEADTSTDRRCWSPRQIASGTENPRNPYRINDYFKIDEEYGTMEDLAELVRAAHALDMKVLLDLVYLHIGPQAPIILKHPEFLQRNEDGSIRYTKYNTPYLNFENMGLREYLWSNMIYYMTAIDVDGFRCDVGDPIPDDFWVEARHKIQLIKSDAVLINEGSKYERIGGSFDTCYTFRWHRDLYACITGTMSAEEVAAGERERQKRVPEGGALLRNMDNHDSVTNWEERVEVLAGHDGMEALLALNYCMPGFPMVYCGNELADTAPLSLFANRFYRGKYGVTDRTALKQTPAGIRRQEIIRDLNRIRREKTAIHSPWMEWLKHDRPEQVMAFRRGKDGNVVFAVNLSAQETEVTLAMDSLEGKVLLEHGAKLRKNTVRLEAYGYVLVELA